jgi:mRNA interferase HicA
MTASELKRWLKSQGCSFEESKKHTKVILKSNSTWMPRHPSQEIKKGTLNSILRDLRLRKD